MKRTFKILILGCVLVVLSLIANNVNAQISKNLDSLGEAFLREVDFTLENNTGAKEALKIYSQYQNEGLNMLITQKLSFEQLYSYQIKMITTGGALNLIRVRNPWYKLKQNHEINKLIKKTKNNIQFANSLMKSK